ncbi:DUF1801 domain-containing protein [Pedobacter mendelii]|uniref:YdhG-like domain-containing protein n=1 Tax=Pedobacter mendelii TaxID=1908240 RepID=A0ABQ2BBK1_9SPHI|nr:DUF1801 domain-containing protein [Pedobacter mendelii]GGI22063.1 hypothetical protein GCM10008119_00770 [Pedobacter mendelii]
MAKNKTTENADSVTTFLNKITEEIKRKDSFELVKIFEEVSAHEAKMWGTAIVGFGSYHYKYASGHEGDAPLAGFSPRKDAFALYFLFNNDDRERLLEVFGKHKSGKACVYIKKLSDINPSILKEMIITSIAEIKKLYPE